MLSAEALYERAARLPRIEIRRPPRVIGRNTVHCMQSGLFHGYVAMVEGLVDRIRSELEGTPKIVATGGLAATFADHLDVFDGVHPDLTLEGLRLVKERNP